MKTEEVLKEIANFKTKLFDGTVYRPSIVVNKDEILVNNGDSEVRYIYDPEDMRGWKKYTKGWIEAEYENQ